jgi:hypothetical protein
VAVAERFMADLGIILFKKVVPHASEINSWIVSKVAANLRWDFKQSRQILLHHCPHHARYLHSWGSIIGIKRKSDPLVFDFFS